MDLHGAGYIHRDLKPGNIIWLPSQNRWTLIDFGCAARIGTQARMGFSVMYAAPEVVRGHYREGHDTVTATPALDAWALGVLAVEMFSGRPALRIFEGREQVGCSVPDLHAINIGLGFLFTTYPEAPIQSTALRHTEAYLDMS
jgi:serine/threonine protein kinase